MEKTIGFHLPGIIKSYPVILAVDHFMKKNPDHFREGVYVASVYGTYPTSVWNGGRFIQGLTDEKTIRLTLESLNNMGIPVRFTYTNPLITEEQLDDRFCNRVLQMADNGVNEVIVNSPILEDYIRKNYPNYKITSSTCKQLENADDLNSELDKDYNLVVLDYNLNKDFEILKNIKKKEKCELLVDACCVPHCPRRGEHYRQIGSEHIRYWNDQRNHVAKIVNYQEFPCQYMCNSIYNTLDYETRILPDEVYDTYVPMGFKQFKIEGRYANNAIIIDKIAQYMAKPEHRDQVRLDMSCFVFRE
jgi:collagenase-like PrtC family protease